MNNANLLAIPAELRSLNQWCYWSYEDRGGNKPTKVPYNVSGNLVSVTDPSTWCSFDQVYDSFTAKGYDGIGFIFSDNDPFAFIDLDECSDTVDMQRQIKIYQEFDSYSEISPSGKGLHIIIKGKLPQGRRRSHIEIYSSQRYATMTGNVYNNKPVVDRDELLNMLFKQMGGSPTVHNHTGDEPQRESDEEIIDAASRATNGDKFTKLLHGGWQDLYGSQSEADFAFIDIIAFYTQNRNQIVRIFKLSALGKRAKANRKDYVEWMINKSFDRLLPKIDFDGFRIALEEKLAAQSNQFNGSVAQSVEPSPHKRSGAGSIPAASTILPPQGLIGDIARFIYEAAPRPVPEIAIAAAIGLMAGICGRAYNISGTGLNQYILLLAMTGAGKEAMASGIDKIINEVQKSVPVAPEFIGPSRIASGQALYKYMAAKSQCFVSIIGEFGKRLEAMSSKTANSAEKQLIAELLDLYNKSGFGQTAKPSIYSDQDKNTHVIQSPSFSILGESTPDTFYASLNEDMISDGLLPRFMLIEYRGQRPPLNENHVNAYPSFQLVEQISNLMANAKTIMASRRIINIGRTDKAAKMLNDFNVMSDNQINATDKETVRQLWNRAHIKVLKIAGLVAVGRNFIDPVVSEEDVIWAKRIVEHDIVALSKKFDDGEVGQSSEEVKQIKEIKRMVREFHTLPFEKIKKYEPDERYYSAKFVTNNYLQQRVYGLAAFRKDTKVSRDVAFKRGIKILIDNGFITEIPRKDLISFGSNAKAYMVTKAELIDND